MSRRLHRLAIPLVALVAALSITACGDLGDMLRLSAGLRKDFGQAKVGISNGSHLTVTLQRAPADEEQTARRAAEYVRDHYRKYGRLDDVSVVFETHRQNGPVGYTRGNGGYTFTRAELGAPRQH
jgi:hypothetical protein